MTFLEVFMDKATKYYKKALTKYHNGHIDQAIDLCGASVAENNKYKAAASLKGILFYFKGDLENARQLWDFNVRVNKDVVSKKYIENTRFDDKFLPIYASAIALINELKIGEALTALKECEESDFNVINVSNHIAVCLIKQGEFEKAKEYLDKVLTIDIKNKMALDNIKMLKKYRIIERKFSYTPLVICLVIVLILGSGLGIYFSRGKKVATVPPVVAVKPKEKSEAIAKPIPLAEVFPYDTVKTSIATANYDELDKQYNLWKSKSVDDKGKVLLENALVLIKDKGLKVFYDKAQNYLTQKDYNNAFVYYYKVYSYGHVDYLYESALYALGNSKEKLGNTDEALKYYEEYSAAFPNGSYEATVLYTLANLYSKTDINKAKVCAKILLKNFPKSDYNNNVMKALLSK